MRGSIPCIVFDSHAISKEHRPVSLNVRQRNTEIVDYQDHHEARHVLLLCPEISRPEKYSDGLRNVSHAAH